MRNYLIVPVEFPLNRKYVTSPVDFTVKNTQALRIKVWNAKYGGKPGEKRPDWTYSTFLYVYGPKRKDGVRVKVGSIAVGTRDGSLWWNSNGTSKPRKFDWDGILVGGY